MNNRDAGLISRIRPNIYAPSWEAVLLQNDFPWHQYAHLPHSSQALSVDVFGRLVKMAPMSRDAVLSALAASLGIPEKGPWSVEPEWLDPENHLREKRRTQVDVLLTGRDAIICIECKFTETSGGTCSQQQPLKKGRHKGQRQCNGNYEWQTNPVNDAQAPCALSGKGIRYWDAIPRVTTFSANNDYRPCPFGGTGFQWMRNMVLSHAVANSQGRMPAFLIMYADAPALPIPKYLSGPDWHNFRKTVRTETIAVGTVSFQSFIDAGEQALIKAGLPDQDWSGLRPWVNDKIARAVKNNSDNSDKSPDK